MHRYKDQFDSLLGVKNEPNQHEIRLFERGSRYIEKITKIPGIEMIAIVNSLSMYATHDNSDIDLFIVTRPGLIWFVRFFTTLTLWRYGVWRKNDDIAGNFCLSFFMTTDSLDLSEISIDNDIYLYYWIYYLKPIYVQNNTYETFVDQNNWVTIEPEQLQNNKKYQLYSLPDPGEIEKHYFVLNQIMRWIFLPRTRESYRKLENQEGTIISDTMLKFHNLDRRKEIRDQILEKNFDK